MNNFLKNIGHKSKKAFSTQINSKKKDKVLKDYYLLIMKNKKMILNICKNTGLKLCNYNFNFRDLFVQTVICLKKDN